MSTRTTDSPSQEDRATESLIAEIRSLEPPTGIDPAWDQMARDIHAACDSRDVQPTRRLGGWLRSLLEPRSIALGALGAVTIVAVFVLIRGGDRHEPSHPATISAHASSDAGAEAAPPELPTSGDPALRLTAVSELDDHELEALSAALADPGAVFDPDPDQDNPDDLANVDTPLLGPDVLAEAEIVDDELDPTGIPTPNYEALLDELSDEDMDNLDALLGKQQPG